MNLMMIVVLIIVLVVNSPITCPHFPSSSESLLLVCEG